MARFKAIYRIIEEVVAAMSWAITVNEITEINGQYQLDVGCTAYLSPCTEFVDSTNRVWEVVSFTFNEQLLVRPVGHSADFTDTNISLGIPKYLHGTIRLSKEEYQRETRKQDLEPLVYLYNKQQERAAMSSIDLIDRTANVRVFLIMSNNEDMIQTNYDEEVFDPLSNVEEEFYNRLRDHVNVDQFESGQRYERIEHEQFATEDQFGSLKNLFDAQLSALELRIPLNLINCGQVNNC